MNEQVRENAFNTAGVGTPVTVTTTSKVLNLENVKRASLQFIRANHTSGSSTFTLEVSNDGNNWVTFNKLVDNVTNTNAQQLTRVGSVALSSNTSKVYDLDLQHGTYKFMRITATIATDGDAQCVIQKERQL